MVKVMAQTRRERVREGEEEPVVCTWFTSGKRTNLSFLSLGKISVRVSSQDVRTHC
jgi:hypothetical protein